jgi:hypothetical protein
MDEWKEYRLLILKEIESLTKCTKEHSKAIAELDKSIAVLWAKAAAYGGAAALITTFLLKTL